MTQRAVGGVWFGDERDEPNIAAALRAKERKRCLLETRSLGAETSSGKLLLLLCPTAPTSIRRFGRHLEPGEQHHEVRIGRNRLASPPMGSVPYEAAAWHTPSMDKNLCAPGSQTGLRSSLTEAHSALFILH